MVRRALSAGLLVALGVVVSIGCSALVTNELTDIACTQEGAIGPPACKVGQACRNGGCTDCAPKDLCGDGQDNDCNGIADDGCDDGGLGGAGGSGGSGGQPTGGTGGSDVGGTGGTAGSASGGTAGTGATGATGGTGGAPAGTLGTACNVDGDCNPGLFCSDPASHGFSGGSRICMSGCCTTKDCAATDSVCAPADNGYSVCVPASSIGRTVGLKLSGSSCANDAECRTGLCQGGFCVDTCCSDSDCGGSVPACGFRPVKGMAKDAFLCGQPIGSTAYPLPCTSSSACTSGVCLLNCAQACCSKKDCPDYLTFKYKCSYYTGGVRACGVISQTPGSKATGAACSAHSECQSLLCATSGGISFCSDTCCEDTDCGDPSKLGCRPRVVNSGATLLLCVPL